MEERKLKMNFFKSGSGSLNAKATLPITWLRTLGITPDDREFTAIYDDKKQEIVIKKK